jgi:hypothetical protein
MQKQASAAVYFKKWNELDQAKQASAFLSIRDRLRESVERKLRETYQDASVEVEFGNDGLSLEVSVCADSGEIPNGNFGEAIRDFLANCDDPQLKGFQLVTDIVAAESYDVVGGGQGQLYGTGPSEVEIRTEF